jgi:hypothetical protein
MNSQNQGQAFYEFKNQGQAFYEFIPHTRYTHSPVIPAQRANPR